MNEREKKDMSAGGGGASGDKQKFARFETLFVLDLLFWV